MADFLSNLLLRSGLAAASTPAAIFQPRLPALFEATGGVEGIPATPLSPNQTAALPPAVESSVSLLGTLSPITSPAAPADNLAWLAPLSPASPAPTTTLAQSASSLSKPGRAGHQPPQRVVRTQAKEAATASEQTTDPQERHTPTVGQELARADTQSIQTLGVTHLAESPASSPKSAKSILRRPSDPLPVKVVRESSDAPLPVLITSRPAAPQPVLTEANEPVVQIHIGRIEVRAMTPPASPPASRPVPAGPKLSLDEYLHQREGKQ